MASTDDTQVPQQELPGEVAAPVQAFPPGKKGTALSLLSKGDIEGLEAFITANPELSYTMKTKKGLSLLHVAVKTKGIQDEDTRVKTVEFLLGKGIDVNLSLGSGLTPLLLAVEYNRLQVAELLLNRGADIHKTTAKGWTVLHAATKTNNAEFAKLFVSKGLNPHQFTAPDNKKLTLLAMACKKGSADLVRALINDESLGYTENGTVTPLWIAIMDKNNDALAVLLEQPLVKAAINTPCKDRPIQEAVEGEEAAIPYKLAAPLHVAILHGNLTAVKLLLAAGADVACSRGFGWSPLHLAAYCGYKAIAEELLKHGADVHAKNSKGCTPLLLSLSERVKGARISTRGGFGQRGRGRGGRPMRRTVRSRTGRVTVAAVPVEDAESAQTSTDSQAKPEDMADFLLTHGGSLTDQDASGFTLLHLAAAKGQTEVVRLLLGKGAEFVALANQKSSESTSGLTPLMMAVVKHHADTVDAFLEVDGVNVNVQQKDGWSVLHMAGKQGDLELMKKLVAKGGDLALKDKREKTPVNKIFAKKNRRAFKENVEEWRGIVGEEGMKRYEEKMAEIKKKQEEAKAAKEAKKGSKVPEESQQ